MLYKKVIRPILFKFDPEQAHSIIHFIGKALPALQIFKPIPNSRKVCDLEFRNPVGLAAGFDKNAELCNLIYSLGFGFTEIGSVTNLPSKGNPKPRIFRIPEEHALINRMGLNNHGANILKDRLIKLKRLPGFPIGVNIAKTHSPEILGDDGIRDMVSSFGLLKPHADYITLNISCPNTKEGKTFEEPRILSELLSEIQKLKGKVPVFIKLSPDLAREKLDAILNSNSCIDGFVISNTKKDGRFGGGGLSGRPITELGTEMIKHVRKNSKLPIIASGGINSVESALDKINAGATLLQIYTGLIYEGPLLVKRISDALLLNKL